MINFLSSWVKNLSLALIIVSILEMILPNNKTKKYVKMVMGLYILFSIISPFIENSDMFDFKDVNLLTQYTEQVSTATIEGDEVDQSSMDSNLNKIYEDELKKDVIQKIEEKGYIVGECKVEAHISKNEDDNGIEKISIKITEKKDQENNDGNQNGTSQNNTNSIEDKIVTEIQKIQKVEVDISESGQEDENNDSKENSILTKTDIKVIKDFLIKEYGVSERCLRIS